MSDNEIVLKEFAEVLFNKKDIKSRTKNKTSDELLKDKRDFIIDLKKHDIDISTLQQFLKAESDREMKEQYGIRFLFFAGVFSAISYFIICINDKWGLNIPKYAITALIIEVPIQFIGLLYIVARNLFPKS